MKIMYIQYAGDFREAYNRLIVSGGREDYYGQEYSVKAVVRQSQEGFDVVVLTTITEHNFIKQLADNLVAIGLGKDICIVINRYFNT